MAALLWTVIIVTVIGSLTHTGGGLINIALVMALVIVIFNLITGRKTAT